MKKILRVLLVTPCSPFNPRSGAEQRTALLYDALEQLGKTDILIVSPTDGPSQVRLPEDSRIRLEFLWRQSGLGISKYQPEDFYAASGSEKPLDFHDYDIVVGRYLGPICKLRIPTDIPTVVDLDDWGKSYGTYRGFSLAALYERLKGGYAHWLARRQLSRFDGFFFVSKRDSATEQRGLSEVLPNIPFYPTERALPDTQSKNIIFVGALWYLPNVSGIEHFLKKCWPLVRAGVPEATLTLVGAAPPRARSKWEEIPGVRAVGFADDLLGAYRSASFSIAPIYFGGGTNIKILESLAFGRACITTPHGGDAFQDDLVANGGLTVARNDADFARLCIEMLNDEQGRTRQALQGKELVNSFYNRERFTTAVLQLAERVLAEKV